MNKWIAAIFVIFSHFFFMSHARAEEETSKLMRCDNCSASQMEAKVRQGPLGGGAEISVYVFDMVNGIARKWVVVRDWETHSTYYQQGQLSSAQTSTFASYRQTYLSIVAYADHTIEIPSTNFHSIYEISGCQACANSWVNANITSISNQIPFIAAFVQQAGQMGINFGVQASDVSAQLQLGNGLKYKVVLITDDVNGPLPAYCMATLGPTGFSVDSNLCNDSDGNPIPVKKSEIGLGYRFTRQPNVNRFGGRVISLGGSFSGGTVTTGPLSIVCQGGACKEAP